MIFVTVGSTFYPFDRLVGAFDGAFVSEDVVIQCGASKLRPTTATCCDFLAREDVCGYMAAARAVVCHAGVGSVSEALRAGKRPIVVPRRRRLGEHVDDHQLEFALRLELAGLVSVVRDPAGELQQALSEPAVPPPPCSGPSPQLVAELRSFVAVASMQT